MSTEYCNQTRNRPLTFEGRFPRRGTGGGERAAPGRREGRRRKPDPGASPSRGKGKPKQAQGKGKCNRLQREPAAPAGAKTPHSARGHQCHTEAAKRSAAARRPRARGPKRTDRAARAASKRPTQTPGGGARRAAEAASGPGAMGGGQRHPLGLTLARAATMAGGRPGYGRLGAAQATGRPAGRTIAEKRRTGQQAPPPAPLPTKRKRGGRGVGAPGGCKPGAPRQARCYASLEEAQKQAHGRVGRCARNATTEAAQPRSGGAKGARPAGMQRRARPPWGAHGVCGFGCGILVWERRYCRRRRSLSGGKKDRGTHSLLLDTGTE